MLKKTIMLVLVLLCFMPFVVDAKTMLVGSQEELLEALSDSSVDTITLSKDIETTEKINITRPVTIDGANHTMKYVGTFGTDASKSNTVWGGIYVLQVYKTTATIKNIKLTGGNAGLLINGSKVTLNGTIDVSGNGFGGIELGKGAQVEDAPSLTLGKDINVVNNTEKESAPTIWVAKDGANGTITMNGITKTLTEGEEFSITEIENVLGLDIAKNPDTVDKITIYCTVLLISIIGILTTYKYFSKENYSK